VIEVLLGSKMTDHEGNVLDQVSTEARMNKGRLQYMENGERKKPIRQTTKLNGAFCRISESSLTTSGNFSRQNPSSHKLRVLDVTKNEKMDWKFLRDHSGFRVDTQVVDSILGA